MTRPNYLPSTYDIFIGIDVGKNSFSFTVEDEKDMMRSKTIPSNPEQFFCYIEKRTTLTKGFSSHMKQDQPDTIFTITLQQKIMIVLLFHLMPYQKPVTKG